MSAIERHGHSDLLGSVPPEYRQSILEQCGRRRCKKNEILWHQGDSAGYLGFLIQGKAMSTYTSPNGKVGITGFWSSGDILGGADLGVTCTRQMTVRCLADSHIFTLAKTRFFDISARFPEVSRAMITALSIRLRWVAHLAVTLETRNAFGRICLTLLALAETFPEEHEKGTLIDLSLTNDFLAAIIGVTRQFANITLHELQREELVYLYGRRIVVRDLARLKAIAYSSTDTLESAGSIQCGA